MDEDDAPDGVLASWRTYAALHDPEPAREVFGVKVPGEGGRALAHHWEYGEGGAEIRWGTPGSMERCISHLTGKLRDPGGYCATRHHAVTGQWPTEHGKAGLPS